MELAIPYLIAVFSTTAFVALWFWVVKKELQEKKRMLEAAKIQLTASEEQCARVRDGVKGRETQEIRKRSQSVYRQAVGIYNKTLCKPWNAVPAFILGHRLQDDGNKNKLY